MTSRPPLRAVWRSELAAPRFRALTVAAPVVVTVVLLALRHFLDVIEARPGATLADPLLPLLPPRDVATLVFAVLHLSLIFGLATLARTPRRLVAGLWSYAAMLVVRMIVMYLTPLDPPAALVPLRDPFVELFGEPHTLTRDLFFSGHTATLFLLALAVPTRGARAALLVATLFVALGVLMHHAHYTVDVVAAPFFAFVCHRAGSRLVEWAGLGVQHSTQASRP